GVRHPEPRVVLDAPVEDHLHRFLAVLADDFVETLHGIYLPARVLRLEHPVCVQGEDVILLERQLELVKWLDAQTDEVAHPVERARRTATDQEPVASARDVAEES